MTITLEQVVPWGRSKDEYVRFFDLSASDMSSRIVGVGDGPASFGAELGVPGRFVVSCDPIYQFKAEELRQRIDATHDRLLAAVTANADLFVWNDIRSPEHLSEIRMAAMRRFLDDYAGPDRRGCYIAGALPCLPFADSAFDLALCSHLLFLYSEHLSYEMHLRSIIEMCRIAREVRIFPLIMLGNAPSPHFEPLLAELRGRHYKAEVRDVPYEFQKGGHRMLTVTRC